MISLLVENGIDIQSWNVFSIVPRVVKQKREMLMQKRKEEKRLEGLKNAEGNAYCLYQFMHVDHRYIIVYLG